MKIRKKALGFIMPIVAAVFAVCALCGIPFNTASSVNAEENERHGYYYSRISVEARRLYDAIGQMHGDGTLKSGNGSYDLVSSEALTAAQLETVTENSAVMAAFGAARDAYYLDHPELFYIDFSRLTINVGTVNGEYTATLGSGRADTYYIENGFSSATEIDTAIAAFDTALNAVVGAADGATDDAAKVRAVNTALANRVTYSFCSSTNESGATVYESGAPYIRNAYGSLVNGKAVCEGYATAFKCAMDRLGIDCVTVQGYASADGGVEPHAWNYVKIDGSWYGVDPTWNDSAVRDDEYLLRGKSAMDVEHIPNGIISASGYKFTYPELNPNDYGFVAVGLNINVSYNTSGNGAKTPVYKIDKDGKNAEQLKAEGLYLAYRYCYEQDGEFVWSDWTSVCEVTGGTDKDGYTEFLGINTYVIYAEFALIDRAPDKPWFEGGENIVYDSALLKEIDFAASSEVYGNEGYGTFLAPPFVKSTTPSAFSVTLDATETYDIVITYTENLRLKDDKKPVELSVTTVSGDAMKYAEITDITWSSNAPDEVRFKFTPSGMFNHRSEIYSFIPTNLIGADSEKAPMPVSFYIKNENVVCNKVYGDGRLYIKSYGQPSLVGQGDLSMTGWKDGNGNYVSENQRSQLMLVATKPSKKQSDDMIDSAAQKANVAEKDVLSSQTFEIQMNICKNIVKIPDGSTVQMAFGFPDGYGPEDEGVVFKVYHFRRDADGKIDYSKTEEMECIVTKYGLVVNVSDFSPFAVVALDAKSVQNAKKSVFARALTYGGSITSDTEDGSTACLLAENESVVFTLTPDKGYSVESVTLNGKSIEASETVTLTYAELKNINELEVRFVADSVAEYEREHGISVVYPSVVMPADSVETPGPAPAPEPGTGTPEPSDNGGLPWYGVLLIVLGVLVLVGGGAAAAVIVIKKRKANK